MDNTFSKNYPYYHYSQDLSSSKTNEGAKENHFFNENEERVKIKQTELFYTFEAFGNKKTFKPRR